MSCCLQASASLPPSLMEQMFNIDLIEEQSVARGLIVACQSQWITLSPVHTLIQIQCGDHKGLLYDIMNLHKRIFLAEIGRHVVDDREWEVYRVHFGEDHELSSLLRSNIVDGVTNMLMGWD